MKLLVISRHGESTLNIERRVNGDPAVPVTLTGKGRDEAKLLGEQLAHVPLDLCIHTQFSRTRETAEIALRGREVPRLEEPLLGDIKIGELEGKTLDDYRAAPAHTNRKERFPGGESLDEAALRYAGAFERLLGRNEAVTLVVCHEIPVRYLANAAAGGEELNGPLKFVANADPYLFDETSLQRAVERIRELAG